MQQTEYSCVLSLSHWNGLDALMDTGIPLVPSADVDLSPVMTFAIRPAFAKPKEKVKGNFFPLVSPPAPGGRSALSSAIFDTSRAGPNLLNFLNIVGVYHVGGLKVALRVVAVRVEIDVSCKDDVVHHRRCRLQLLPDLGQGGRLQDEVRPLPVEAVYQDSSTWRSTSTFMRSTLRDVELNPDQLHQ
jgi:hypothetical protein